MAVPQLFAGGLQLPVQPDAKGGFRKLSGDDYLIQTILILCGDGESDNPFLDVGVGSGAVFQNASDAAWKAVIRQKVTQIFKDLTEANLARLRDISFKRSLDKPEESVAKITFLSIESNTILEVETSTSRRG